MLQHLFIFIFLFHFSTNSSGQSTFSQNTKIDSIHILNEFSRNEENTIDERFSYAYRATQLSKQVDVDSLILRSNEILSILYFAKGDMDLFKAESHKNLKLANKIGDSMAIATASFNIGYYHEREIKHDSAYYYYYKAINLFEPLNQLDRVGGILVNMANIQETERDYVGAEENATKAITILLTLPETNRNLDRLWSLYNLLAVISTNLNEQDETINYHKNALDIANEIEDNFFYITSSKTNLGYAYMQFKNYDKAIKTYSELLKNYDLSSIDDETYAIVLGNLAYARFLNEDKDYSGIEIQFNESYRIAENIGDIPNLAGILNNMSGFLFAINKKDEALVLVKKGLQIAKTTNYNEEVLKSLKLLSKIERGEKSVFYLNEYIKLNDSLLQKERSFQNKFAKIRFNTDQIKADNVTLSKERLLFLILSIGLFVLLALVYVVITQRNKNRELKFVQTQQQANEEIYNLMLVQQDKIEEGRTVEKKRISQELHDGILGRLFGTRLSLDSLNMIHTDDAVKNREKYINELQTIEQEIRKISHDLNADFIVGTSFIDLVKTLIETQTQAYGLDYHFTDDTHINWDDVSNKNKIHIYRMLQETMQNIYKHAKASYINIGFQLKKDVILVTVGDDGIGFNTEKAKKGIGIKNINARVKDFGGKVNIDSVINEGTIITITIPLN